MRPASSAVLPSALIFLTLVGCYDLELTNPNQPDRERALADADAVERLVASSFKLWYTGNHQFQGPFMLSSVSFQHSVSSPCWAPHAGIPRVMIDNEEGNQCAATTRLWDALYAPLAAVADGLMVLDANPTIAAELGPDATARLRAYGRFVQGIAHGSVALLFDRGAVLDETTERGLDQPLLEYPALMERSLAYLAEAAALAEGADWPAIPAEWMMTAVTPDQLRRLARAFSARLRASVARTPQERSAVDWVAVRTDARAAIAEDWVLQTPTTDGEWDARLFPELFWVSEHTQLPYFIAGMADRGGSYQRWLDRPVNQRVPDPDPDGDGEPDPILIVTPDTRFPQGATVEDQAAAPGTLFEVPTAETRGFEPRQRWIRPDRGTWRWSYYWHTGVTGFLESLRWPEITVAELRLLEAEALLRSGDTGAAAALINLSRTAAGLGATDATGANDDCVPRLPDERCGDLMEMLKWEKRLETYYTGAFNASWYFDGRGWGDLYAGTFLQLPVPCDVLLLLDEPCITFGGPGNDMTSPGSIYGWPGEP